MNKAIDASEVQLSLLPEQVNPRKAFRDVRNYLAGRFVGSTRDTALLDEVVKLLFCKLIAEREGKKELLKIEADVERAKAVREIFSKVRDEFSEIFEDGAEVLLDPESIRVVLDLCAFDVSSAESDAVGDAFEVFVGSESKSRAGQFFTPRIVTDLLVDVVSPKPNETVIDPACGAGGFLASTIRHHLANGIDLSNISAIAANLYGVDKDSYLVNLAKVHIALLSGGHPKVESADSISWKNAQEKPLSEIPEGGYDVVLTNPPFGARIVSGSAKTLSQYELARKWRYNSESCLWEKSNISKPNVPPQVVFVERCLGLLKEGGRMGIVVPESLISNKSHRYVVQYIRDRADITAVLGMPDELFKTSGKGGTHTKTCLLVAEKREGSGRKRRPVFMAEAKWCGHDSRARSIEKNDLPKISENYTNWVNGRLSEESPLGFSLTSEEINNNVLCPHYYDPKIDEEIESARKHSEILDFGSLVESGVLDIATGDELGKLAYGTGSIPFIRTSDISNWELKHDAKHGVSREIYEKFCRKQDVRPGDILMVKDGTYLIGTCAMVTQESAELLYQSHIYKIRVNANEIGLTPEILLVGLSTNIVQRQIRAKRFTMDIIDSLGDRIYELKVPIPKSKKKRKEISASIEKAFEARREARKLIVQAKAMANGGIEESLYDLRNSG